jgi:GT2 family glycosyltransferase
LETAVVIVNYRTMYLTRDAVASVLGEPEVSQVCVVDNASGDGSAAHLRQSFVDERFQVVESDWNRGFGPAVNVGAAACQAPLLFILNSDATLVPRSLGRLARALIADEGIGVVAPAVYNPDGRTLQPGTYGRLPRRPDILLSNGWVSQRADNRGDAKAPGWVSGVAMLVRRADFLALGGFDERFTMYMEDVDLCRRMHALGRSILREPEAAVLHHGGRSWRSSRDQRRRFHESKLRYFEKLGASRFELRCVRIAGLLRTNTVRTSSGNR